MLKSDLAVGSKFGRLTVVARLPLDEKSRRYYTCRCDCGKEVTVRAFNLVDEVTRSCGCIKSEKVRKSDLAIGSRFGRLTVNALMGTENGGRRYACLCDCGKETIAWSHNLTKGTTRSCGCLSSEKTAARNTTHGGRGSEHYSRWRSIKTRCFDASDPGYAYYGARGVTMHGPWTADFAAFDTYLRQTLGPKPSSKHTLDRIDNSLGYCPGNLRWATRAEQSRNRRSNTMVEYNGETLCLSEWALRLGAPYESLRYRMKVLGMPPEVAFTTPFGELKRGKKVKQEI